MLTLDRGRKVICHYCKEQFYKDELIQINSSKRACSKCNETIVKDGQDYKNLVDYICTGFNIKAPTGQQLKDIKKFKDMGYSYIEMQMTLYYIYVVLKKQPSGTSIGLIPFYKEQAMEHFRLIENAKRSAVNISHEEVVIERKSTHKPNLKNTRIIDISTIV